jgi:hypothetical protein
MDSTLTDEQRDIRDWVRTFVRKELLLLEPEVLTRERAHEPAFARASTRRSATWGEPGVALASAAPGYPGEEELLGRYQQDSGWPGAWPRRRCLPP